MSFLHDLEDTTDECYRDLRMEKIAHGVDEDSPGLLPLEGEVEDMLVDSRPESLRVVLLPHRLEALCHALGVAVLASWAGLGTACDRVPGRPRPFDLRYLPHCL